MSGPITAQALQTLLGDRAPDVDKALRAVSPIGLNIGIGELQLFLGVDATTNPAAFAERAIAYLTAHRLIDEFSALVQPGEAISESKAADMQMPLDLARRLMNQTVGARCAILRDGAFQGSGCLVGPRLVLTCAHVLGVPRADGSFPEIEVLLSTNVRVGAETKPLFFSAVSKADDALTLSENDADYAGYDDYALLRMRLPVGASAAVALVETDDWLPAVDDPLTLFHYPGGKDRGIGFAFIGAFENPSARWAYRSAAEPGSSGGACFNVRGALVGLHQGKLNKGSRLIPFRRFRDMIAPAISEDIAPTRLWSVDGHLDGTLVIDRDELFTAFAKLAERGSTYRLLRVRRIDPTQGGDGLGYTVRLVQQLVRRRPDGHSVITLGWPLVVQQDFDIITQLEQYARNQGLPVDEMRGTALLADRAGGLLRMLDGDAAARGETLWIVIEHSVTPLGDQTAALEALASQAPLWPNLRLVLVGNEGVSLPGPEYRVSDIGANHLPGVALVEYIRPFTRAAVEGFIGLIHEDLVGEAPSERQQAIWTDHVLSGLPQINGSYALTDLPEVTRRLRRKFGEVTPMAQAA